MKRSACLCLGLMMTLVLSAGNPVSAEIYHYMDKNGETHYTNDAASIPKQYQKQLQVKGETVVYPDETAEPETTTDTTATKPPAEGKIKKTGGNLSEVEALKAQKEAFDNESKALQEERDQLDQQMKNARTRADVDKVNAATEALNARIKDFKQRRKAFDEQVLQYNKQVKKDMEEKLKKYNETEPQKAPEETAE